MTKKKSSSWSKIKTVWDGGRGKGLSKKKVGKAKRVKDAGGRWGLRKAL